MAALDFPNTPTINQVFTSGGSSWTWDGVKWVVSAGPGGKPLISGNNLADVASVPTSRSNLGLGTMAVQNAASVAITGGTITGSAIDGTVIGGTTPAAATFTNATCNGTVTTNSLTVTTGTPVSQSANAGWNFWDRGLGGTTGMIYRSGAVGRLWLSDYGDVFAFNNAGGCSTATTMSVGTSLTVNGNVTCPSVAGSGGVTIGSAASYPLYVHVTGGHNAWILNQVDGVRQWGSGCDSAGNYYIYDMSGSKYGLLCEAANGHVTTGGTTIIKSDYGNWGAGELETGTVNGFVADGIGSTTAITGYCAANLDVQNGNSYLAFFTTNSRATAVGSIVTNGSSTIYNTTSDARRKKNMRPLAKEIDVGHMIDAIEPVAFEWTHLPDEPTGHGFIAQDLYKVAPEAVRPGFDDVELHPWGVDFSKLVPYIIAEMQQMRARIAELETSHG
jgi:Chaperone of endosialidase